MLLLIVDFVNLFLSALLVGAMFCAWLVFNPAQLDASHYIIVQQQGIRTLNSIMPLLGGLTILMTVASAVLAHENRTRMSMLIGTALLFIISGLITRFGNSPSTQLSLAGTALLHQIIGLRCAIPGGVGTACVCVRCRQAELC